MSAVFSGFVGPQPVRVDLASFAAVPSRATGGFSGSCFLISRAESVAVASMPLDLFGGFSELTPSASVAKLGLQEYVGDSDDYH